MRRCCGWRRWVLLGAPLRARREALGDAGAADGGLAPAARASGCEGARVGPCRSPSWRRQDERSSRARWMRRGARDLRCPAARLADARYSTAYYLSGQLKIRQPRAARRTARIHRIIGCAELASVSGYGKRLIHCKREAPAQRGEHWWSAGKKTSRDGRRARCRGEKARFGTKEDRVPCPVVHLRARMVVRLGRNRPRLRSSSTSCETSSSPPWQRRWC
jgi:hypothetical protein